MKYLTHVYAALALVVVAALLFVFLRVNKQVREHFKANEDDDKKSKGEDKGKDKKTGKGEKGTRSKCPDVKDFKCSNAKKPSKKADKEDATIKTRDAARALAKEKGYKAFAFSKHGKEGALFWSEVPTDTKDDSDWDLYTSKA